MSTAGILFVLQKSNAYRYLIRKLTIISGTQGDSSCPLPVRALGDAVYLLTSYFFPSCHYCLCIYLYVDCHLHLFSVAVLLGHCAPVLACAIVHLYLTFGDIHLTFFL